VHIFLPEVSLAFHLPHIAGHMWVCVFASILTLVERLFDSVTRLSIDATLDPPAVEAAVGSVTSTPFSFNRSPSPVRNSQNQTPTYSTNLVSPTTDPLQAIGSLEARIR